MRLAVVGHVEWIDFLRVERVPAQGEIVHASRGWGDAAGGGAVAAVQLANLAGEAMFFTTFGADERGRQARERLEQQHVRVFAREIDVPQRYGVTFVDDEGERTITVVGERLTLTRRRSRAALGRARGADGVYFVSGDAATVRRARQARVLVAASRSLECLQEAGVELDAIVGSAHRRRASATGTATSYPAASPGRSHRGGARRHARARRPLRAGRAPGPDRRQLRLRRLLRRRAHLRARGRHAGRRGRRSGRPLRRHGSHRPRPLRAPVQARRLTVAAALARRYGRSAREPDLRIAPSRAVHYECRPADELRLARLGSRRGLIVVAKWGIVV